MSENKLPIGFALADVQTEQFAIIETAYKDNQMEDIQLLSSFKFGFNEVDKSILASPRFSFEQNGVAFLILEVGCIFKISKDSWGKIYNEQDSSVELSMWFAAHIAALSVGVARGVLHAKTEQTPFNKFMIPLINVAENITENIVLK